MQFENIDKLKNVILQNQTFVLIPHINPDGDALGSTLGLSRILNNLGKTSTVIAPDNAPSFYSWIPGIKQLMVYERQQAECDAIIDNSQVIFYLDFNCLQRLKTLGEKLISHKAVKVMIDHHLYPEIETDLMFSDPSAPATCELVFNIMQEAGFNEQIDTQAATCFYSGIITDTGGLSYNSSKPETYITVAALLSKGIDKTFIHEKIFNNRTFKRLQLLGYCLNRKMQRIEKLPITIMALSDAELIKFRYNTGDTEGFVNFPLSIKDISVSALIIERPDKIKMSFRSKGEFPVNEFSAKYFGGGGHKNAAGGTFIGKLDDAVEHYRKNITDFYLKWEEEQKNNQKAKCNKNE